MKFRKPLLAFAIAAFVTGTASGQSMVGGPHDFTAYGWAGNEICKPCHTPHTSLSDETGNPVGWLWNHELTTATITLYDGTTASAGPDTGTAAFDKLSRLCMGCHDGTVALDAYSGATTAGLGVSATFISSINARLEVGTDLRDDHPVGSIADYENIQAADPTHFVAAAADHTLAAGALKLRPMSIGGVTTYVVGCMTCHTPHNKGFAHQLRMDNTGSAMCLSCHIK